MSPPAQKSYSDLVKHFVGTVAGSGHGKLLLTIWVSYLGLLATLPKRKKAAKKKVTGSEEEEGAEASKQKQEAKLKRKPSSNALMQLIRILRKGASHTDCATFIAYVLSLTSRIFVTVKLADLSGNLASFMGARRYTEMFLGQAWFGLFCIIASTCTAMMKFLEAQCESCARDILFRYLKERYLDPETLRYYRQELPDAPARLSADLKEFSTTLVHSTGHFLKPLIDVAYLSAVMSKRIGLRQVAIFYGFFWFSDWSINRFRTRALPKSLKQSTIERQELESGIRDNLTRVHHYREQIAMQKGTEQENLAITKQFKEYQRITQFELYMSFALDCVKSYTIKYGGLMCAFSIITPSSYLDPSKTPEEITASFMANASLLGSLASAVKDMADSLNELQKIRGYAERVYELDESMRKCEEKICKNDLLQVEGDKFDIEGVSILAPSTSGAGTPLIDNLNFELNEGEHTVVRGPNGIGKSSIFRTLTGLWKAEKVNESAKLHVPESCFVVPQDTYFPNNKRYGIDGNWYRFLRIPL